MRSVTPTLIWYYYVCEREVWLMSHEINPEQDNSLIELGRIVHEFSYKRDTKEISVEGMKFDVVRTVEGNVVVCEIKKTSNFELPSRMQLAYYLYNLKKSGFKASGELLFPKEKRKVVVELDETTEKKLEEAEKEIQKIISLNIPPKANKTIFCTKCAYAEFCWA
ncbi:MAG TPA: CRISPR-associated protein Cas4 [Halobacteria archaeon]|nr:CRISPR-associated protein Cas4 [Halobacteria archaeon]